jgi:hypothetical protein
MPAAESRDGGGNLAAASCPSCGAQLTVLSTTLASTQCAYCRSPVVLLGQLSQDFAPDTVVPFTVSREQAQAALEAWLARKRYLAPGFYSKLRQDPPVGVYFPYMVIDAQVDSTAEGGATFRPEDSEDAAEEFRVLAKGNVQLQGLPQSALRATRADKVMNLLQPWDLRREVPFAPGYLAGFQTERRDLDFADIASEAALAVSLAARRVLAGKVFEAYPRCRQLRLWGVSQILNSQYHHTLLPAWVVYYLTPSGGLYYFGVNGQTHETVGSVPVDMPKLKRHATGVALLTALVIMLLAAGVILPFAGIVGGSGVPATTPALIASLLALVVAGLAGWLAWRIMCHSVLKKYGLMRREDPPDQAIGWTVAMTDIRAQKPKDDKAVAARYAALGSPSWAHYTRPQGSAPHQLPTEVFWAPDGKTPTSANKRGIVTLE